MHTFPFDAVQSDGRCHQGDAASGKECCQSQCGSLGSEMIWPNLSHVNKLRSILKTVSLRV